MFRMLTVMSIGLVLTVSLSAAEMSGVNETADEALLGSADPTASPVVGEHSNPRDAGASVPLRVPAWQERGFVMDVVVATAEPAAFELPEAKPISPDLEELLKLHQATRSLEF